MRSHFHHWTDNELRIALTEVRVAYAGYGLEGVIRQLILQEVSEEGRFLGRIINPEGRVLFETAPGLWAKAPIDEELVRNARSGKEDFEISELDYGKAGRVFYSPMPDGSVVQLGLSLLEHEIWIRKFAGIVGKVAILTFILSICAGGFMARRALNPIRQMARTASAITGRSLGQRVPLSGRGDEVDQLAAAFNAMLGRIDTLVEGLRDVTDTIAHDLRTPITGIRGMAEVTLRSPRDGDTYRMTLYQTMEQMDRLLTMFDSILDVAEAESGTLALKNETVVMDEVADEIVQAFGPVAQDKGIRLEWSVHEGLVVRGDRGRLTHVLINLIDNAIKYTPSGGSIRLTVESHSTLEGVLVTVADTGIGISGKDLPHIFERYYRGDESRSGPGVGLGLPLAQGIIKSHGGSVTVESRPGYGSMFHVFLPFDSHA
jgi:signal transduction histidine kinase